MVNSPWCQEGLFVTYPTFDSLRLSSWYKDGRLPSRLEVGRKMSARESSDSDESSLGPLRPDKPWQALCLWWRAPAVSLKRTMLPWEHSRQVAPGTSTTHRCPQPLDQWGKTLRSQWGYLHKYELCHAPYAGIILPMSRSKLDRIMQRATSHPRWSVICHMIWPSNHFVRPSRFNFPADFIKVWCFQNYSRSLCFLLISCSFLKFHYCKHLTRFIGQF